MLEVVCWRLDCACDPPPKLPLLAGPLREKEDPPPTELDRAPPKDPLRAAPPPKLSPPPAVQEDVDAIGLSILSGAHLTLFPRILELRAEKGGQGMAVFGDGIIPQDDIDALKRKGVKEIFTPGASTEDIVAWVRANIHAPA